MLIADCVARFAVCSMIVGCKAFARTNVIVNNWIGTIGKPHRIIMDNGRRQCSARSGATSVTHVSFSWFAHLNRHRTKTAWKNESYGHLKPDVAPYAPKKALVSHAQKISTRAIITRNRVPNKFAGIHPELAMAGRYDLVAGHASAACTRNPYTVGPATQQSNAMRYIPTARTEVMDSDAERALKTRLSRNPLIAVAHSTLLCRKSRYLYFGLGLSHGGTSVARPVTSFFKNDERLAIGPRPSRG